MEIEIIAKTTNSRVYLWGVKFVIFSPSITACKEVVELPVTVHKVYATLKARLQQKFHYIVK